MILTRFDNSGRYFATVHTTEEGADREDQNRIIRNQIDIQKYYHDFETNASIEMPQRPGVNFIFNYATKQWEDPRTLQDHQAAKWSQIKRARTQAEYAGFTWDGSVFDSDATSQNRITGAVTLAQMSAAFSIDWILKDNTVRALNRADMLQVGAALGAHVAMQFARGVLLRGRIEAATTREMVEAVEW